MLLQSPPRPAFSVPSPNDILSLLRARQWSKNVFVLAPAVFGGALADATRLSAALIATLCFCLASSAVYLANDVIDAEADRRHPRKRNRPIAASRVSPGQAIALAGTLGTGAIALSAFLVPSLALLFLSLYLANSALYCFWLKRRVLADVILIAVGFVLRLLAGSAAVGVEPSSWLLACGFALALVLGFGKRRMEVACLGGLTGYRDSLANYTAPKLDALLSSNIAVCLLCYMLYTVAPETVARHGTRGLVYTVPLVAYGLFRYQFKVQEGAGDDPADVLLSDPAFVATGIAWAMACAAVVSIGGSAS